MGTSQRILTTSLWVVAVMGMLAIVGTGLWGKHRDDDRAFAVRANDSVEETTPPMSLFDLPKFKLADQDGKTITDADLRGHVFIASFIFTHCAGPCPMILSKMSALQKTLEGSPVKLVTFTVDPERDTPDVLKLKGQALAADFSRWTFITGDKQSVQETIEAMLMPRPVADQDQQILHETHLYLFDAAGKCQKRYSINFEEEMAKLPKDAEGLCRGQ
jgi:protein SCO1/2